MAITNIRTPYNVCLVPKGATALRLFATLRDILSTGGDVQNHGRLSSVPWGI